MRRSGRHVAAGLASAGLVAGALYAPAPVGAQAPAEPVSGAAATTPAPPAAFVPDPPPARFVPDPTPAPAVVGSRPQPESTAKSRKRERKHAKDTEGGAAAQPEVDPGLAGAVPAEGRMDIPNYFIDTFGVPPFLLPIYQAAGIEYGVRWEVLAAINEIESDYGRNLNVSSAGALGWMQFMPATWRAYGVDANRDGRKDPFNPVDAIFAAARYLKAAGVEKDLGAALFAYNHADWYVKSVLHRARLLAALPNDLVDALSGLAQGRPPVLGPARIARRGPKRARTLSIGTRPDARVVAVTDGEIVRVGHNARLGRFVRLRDAYGNTYTYGDLARVARRYPAVDPNLSLPPAPTTTEQDAAPIAPATAGTQTSSASDLQTPPGATPRPAKVQDPAAGDPVARARAGAPIDIPAGAATGPAVRVAPVDARPLARDGSAPPRRPTRVRATPQPLPANDATAPAWPSAPALAGFDRIATAWQSSPKAAPAPRPAGTSSAKAGRLTAYDRRLLGGGAGAHAHYRTLREGSRVVAGTMLGRSGPGTNTGAPARVRFEIRPAGRRAPRIDPRPIVAGWKLLAASQRGTGAEATIGQVLLLGTRALERRVLADRRIRIYRCGRGDIRAGRVDRRVLATLELLALSGLSPTVSSLRCGHGRLTSSGNVSEHSSGNAVDISAINGIPILGHQGAGSITETAIQRLLSLQGTVRPHQIISLMTFDGAANTLAMTDHDDHIHVGFAPERALNSLEARSIDGVLEPRQWQKIVSRLSRIDNPEVSAIPSRYAVKTKRAR